MKNSPEAGKMYMPVVLGVVSWHKKKDISGKTCEIQSLEFRVSKKKSIRSLTFFGEHRTKTVKLNG